MARIVLVSCGKSKLTHCATARHLYTSPLFRKSREFAETNSDAWYILSAKHGLLEPSTMIEPYDVSIKSQSKESRERWADRVIDELRNKVYPGDVVTLLAGASYAKSICENLIRMGCIVETPLAGQPLGPRMAILNRLNQVREGDRTLDKFYERIGALAKGLAGGRVFRDCHGRMTWPMRGVYFVFEPEEYRRGSDAVHRVVRVGTHAISRGSKSTLWGRLSTHRGTANGLGSHRSSIFRLHLGQAIMARSKGKLRSSSWGVGQSAPKNVRILEENLERMVSEEIASMRVLWIDVPDEPGPASDRTFIESNAIGLLSRNCSPMDPPGIAWLGNYSPRQQIRASGLWNLNHLSDSVHPEFLTILSEYVEITLGRKRAPTESLAPHSALRNAANGQESKQHQLL